MSKNRYYYKKSYKGDYSAFGSALTFTAVGILSLIFDAYNINFIGLRYWGFWLFVPAFFSFTSAIGLIANDRKMRKAVLGFVQSHPGGPIKVETISAQIGMKMNDILRVLVDLRMKGLVQYKYDTQTGEILLGEAVKYQRAPEFTSPPTKNQAETIASTIQLSQAEYYCPYCGQKNPEDSQFCINCGSKLF
ncbi:MAG: zinc-ribbon domain-containing protein [Candidatus Heimdallarchaeaceae archaeon]